MFVRLLQIYLWLLDRVFGDEIDVIVIGGGHCRCRCCRPRFKFTEVSVDGAVITGEIIKMKKEFGFTATFEAKPVGPAGSDYEHGSAVWAISATNAAGDDASADYAVTPDADNELRATVQHSGTQESTALLSLRADGDPDADETAPVVGTADIVVDAPNVTAFEISEVTA